MAEGAGPVVEEAVAVLRDAVDAAQQSSDPAPPPDGGFSFAAESQSVCASAMQPDGAALATGCNDFLVRHVRKALSTSNIFVTLRVSITHVAHVVLSWHAMVTRSVS